MFLGLLLAAFPPFFCLAQQNKLVAGPAQQIEVKRGTTATASLTLTTLPGFHVNSDKPKEAYLIPLKVTWSGGPLEVKSVAYPKPEEIQLGADKLSVFTGSFKVESQFAVPASAPAGQTVVTGKVHYQACNNQMCFRPSTLDVKLPVLIE